MSNFANTYPSLEGTVVMQGHVDYCRDHGHATHSVIGTNGEVESIGERCPRCGDLLAAEYLRTLQREAEGGDLDVSASLYAAWRRAVERDEKILAVARSRAERAEAEREAFEKDEAADAALTRVPAPGDVVTNDAGQFGVVTEAVKKAGIHKGRISVMWAGGRGEVVERPSAVTILDLDPAAVAAFVAGQSKP